MSLYELKNIKKYYNKNEALNIKNLLLESNQIIGFFGPNGSGKSTLFSLLSFLSQPSSGELRYEGKKYAKLSFEDRQNIVIMPQNPYLLKRNVYENIIYGLKIRNVKSNLHVKVKEALEMVGLDESFCNRKSHELSGGEAQRVALATRLILKPKVLMLDEPTVGVDVNSAGLIKEAILNAKQDFGTSIFISSHDHNWLNHICDKKIALFNGKIVESGSINLLFAPWKKDKNGDLLKEFLDGQKLILKDTKDKKRDSVALIDSDKISFTCKSENALKVRVNSISSQNNNKDILLELFVGGVILNKKVSKKFVEENKLLPSEQIYINIDTQNLIWL